LSESAPVEVQVSKEKEASRWDLFKKFVRGKSPTQAEESDRFERLGYLQYPMRAQLDFRVFALEKVLSDIETEYQKVYFKRKQLIDKFEIATPMMKRPILRKRLLSSKRLQCGI